MHPPTKSVDRSLPDATRASVTYDGSLDNGSELSDGFDELEEADAPLQRQSVAAMLQSERAARGLVGEKLVGLRAQWCSCKEGGNHAHKATIGLGKSTRNPSGACDVWVCSDRMRTIADELHGVVEAAGGSGRPSKADQSAAGTTAVASVMWMGATKSGRGAGGGAPKMVRRPASAGGGRPHGGGGGGSRAVISETPFQRWGYRVE